MKLVLWFLKKKVSLLGDFGNGDPIVMSSISYDRTPLGYQGVEVFVKKEVLESGLTKEFLKEAGFGGEDE